MDYVKALVAKRASVWSELEELRARFRTLGDEISLKEAQLRNLDDLLAVESHDATADVPAAPAGRTFVEVAYEIISAADGGIHYQELLRELVERGVLVPGKDPAANLITHLSRDVRFVRTGRGTYGLDGRDRPAAAVKARRVARRSRSGKKSR